MVPSVGRARAHDVVIVGGRVAGASLAVLLARQGRSVLVLDREAFPSDTLSTHFVSALVVDDLARLDVLDDLLTAGFRQLTRARTYVEDCLFEGPAVPGASAFGLAPRRDVLDSLLQQRATEAGAELRTRTRVEGLVEEDGRVVGVVADGREIRARVVVGADGKSSKVAEWVAAESYRDVPAQRPAYYGYYHGLAPLPEPALELFFVDRTVGFVFPMRPGEDCIALELQPDDFDVFRSDPQAVFEERVRALPGMEERLRGASLEDKLKGTKGVANYLRVPYGPGWALTGDAACLKDPITGFGIGDAVAQAFPLAEALGAWLDGGDWDETMAGHQAKRDELLLPLCEFTLSVLGGVSPPTAELDRLRAVLANPFAARGLSYWTPGNLEAFLAPGLAARTELFARMFADLREKDAAVAP
jgi:flavin-dependent dehydrogenase